MAQVGLVIVGFRKKRLRVVGVGLGFLAFLLALVLSSFGLAFVWLQESESD